MSMANPPRQLNLDELRRLKWLLGGAMALVSVWTVFFLDIEALTLVVAVTALIGGALVWPELPARVPALVWRLGVPAIIAAAVVDFMFSPDTLPVLIRLAVLLVLYRTVSYRRKREDLQLIVLGLFLIVVAGVLTVSLGFAFLLLLFTACALGFLFVVTLIDLSEQTAVALTYDEMSQCPTWARLSWKKLFARLRAVANWRLIGFAGGLFVLVVGFSALLFVVIPRFELGGGFFLDKYITRKSRTGFSESVKLGSVSELVQDNSVAMRIDLTDAASLREVPYFRLIVLDEYTADGFKMSTRLKTQLQRSERTVPTLRGSAVGSREAVGGTWTFYVEPGVSRFLPLPGAFGTMRLRERAQVQTASTQQIVALRAEPMTMTAFQLEDVVLTGRVRERTFLQGLESWAEGETPSGEGRGGYDPRVLLRTPEGPVNQAALRRMVAEITQGRTLDAEQFAEAATAWLRGRHAYAMSANIPRGEGDDIVKWLDSREPGFCEFFAAGLTVLSRAAGHPARVVAGFHGGTLNAFENYYMVRNSDAHAWAEIFDGQGAWLRVDATPGAVSVAEAAAAPVMRREDDGSWAARWDSLRVLWYRRVVNFDARSQVEMIDQVKTLTTDTTSALRAKVEALGKKLKAWIGQPWDGKRVGRVAGIVVLVGVWGWSMVRVGRWASERWRGWRRPEKFDPVRQNAGRWLGKMRERGVIGGGSGSSEAAQAIAELQRLRYGARETWPEPRGVFKRAKRVKTAKRSDR